MPLALSSALFTDVEKLVLDYAVGMSRTPVEVSDRTTAPRSSTGTERSSCPGLWTCTITCGRR